MPTLALPQSIILLQIPLLYLTNILTLAIGPKNQDLRIGITLPIFGLLVIQSLYREWTGEWGHHYGLNCMVMTLVFMYVDWNLLSRPDEEKWRKISYETGSGDGKTKRMNEKADTMVPTGFWERAWWGVRLAMGNRYVGWSCQVKNVPVEVDASYPRLHFIARKTIRVVIFSLLKDAVYAYTAASPYGSWSDIAHIKPAFSLAGQPFLTRWWYTWVHIFLTCAALEQANAIYGVVSVATGLANPRDCPSAFGNLRELVTVRNAWSSVWHQQCRRICSTPGVFIVRDVLHLRRGSFASKYLQLFIAFGISAIVHGCGSMLVHRSFEDDGAFVCFTGQAVIIMVEDHAIDLGKRLGLKDSAFWRVVGFAWTIFAVSASMQRWSSKTVSHGMWIHNREYDVFGIGPKIVA